MLKTFNCGIGMVAIVAADRAKVLTKVFEDNGETVSQIGTVTKGGGIAFFGALV